MKRISLVLAIVILASLICSCSKLRRELNPPIPNAGEVITMPPATEAESESESETETAAETELSGPALRYSGEWGSAGTLDGRVLVIPIFANDIYYMWKVDNDEDLEMYSKMMSSLKTACDWLSQKSQEHGKTTTFICDWNTELLDAKRIQFHENMVVNDSSVYSTILRTLTGGIDVSRLQAENDAEDVIFVFFYNTDFSNTIRPSSLSNNISDQISLEYSSIPVRFSEGNEFQIVSASTIAHEILHLFGARDYYTADENVGVPQEYIDHCNAIGSKDIMFTVNGGDGIDLEFSDLTAYYTGLVDDCEELAEWNLPVAERFVTK